MSGPKSTLSEPGCDDRSGGPTGRQVAVSQSLVPLERHGGKELAVRAEVRPVDGRVEPSEPRTDPRTVLERAQERAACVDGVVEAPPLEREEQSQVRVLRCNFPRLGGELPGLCDDGRATRAATLHQGERSGDDGHDQRGRDGPEQDTQAPRPQPGALELAVLRLPTRLQELALDAGELSLLTLQLHCRRQPRPAIQIGLVSSRLVPGAGGDRQLTERQELFPILRQPSTKPRPLADQCLVRDLGRVVAHDQQPGRRQLLEHRGRLPAGLALRDQLRQRDAPSACPPSSHPAP